VYEINRLWPEPTGPLDDEALLAAYPPPAGPGVRMNFVASADGAVSVNGRSGKLGSPADKRVFDLLRVGCDAVLVGAGTLRTERYGPMVLDPPYRAMREAAGLPPDPVLVVVSQALDLDPEHPMLRDAPVRPYLLTHAGTPADRRAALGRTATVITAGDSVLDPVAALAELARLGAGRVLSEGGPMLFGAFAAAGAVDELCLTLAPKLAGPGADRIIAGLPVPLRDMALRHVLHAGTGELFLRYALG
jgi:riboflavin biosynthesis pyrimidine reductase